VSGTHLVTQEIGARHSLIHLLKIKTLPAMIATDFLIRLVYWETEYKALFHRYSFIEVKNNIVYNQGRERW